MAAASIFAFAPAASRRPSTAASLGRRFVNALVASRMDAAARELRRHEALIRETARVHEDPRTIGLTRADLLPFNE